MMRTLKFLLLAATLAALSGCATRWVVDSEVSSHSRLDDFRPGATYRFERLPSQQASPGAQAAQAELEALAAPVLEAAGLRQDDAAARYGVELSAQVQVVPSPWADPWYGGPWGPYYGPRWHWGWSLGWGPRWHAGWHGTWGPPAQPWHLREVRLLLRRLPGGEIVYETRARNDGPHAGSREVLSALLQAALQGFPNPPPGERRVDIELGTKAAQTGPATPAPAPAPAPQPR